MSGGWGYTTTRRDPRKRHPFSLSLSHPPSFLPFLFPTPIPLPFHQILSRYVTWGRRTTTTRTAPRRAAPAPSHGRENGRWRATGRPLAQVIRDAREPRDRICDALTVRVTRARALAWIVLLLLLLLPTPGQPAVKEGDPPSRGLSLTPVSQAGVPIPPIRPLLCQPLNYFFSLPGLVRSPVPDATNPEPRPLYPDRKCPNRPAEF